MELMLFAPGEEVYGLAFGEQWDFLTFHDILGKVIVASRKRAFQFSRVNA